MVDGRENWVRTQEAYQYVFTSFLAAALDFMTIGADLQGDGVRMSGVAWTRDPPVEEHRVSGRPWLVWITGTEKEEPRRVTQRQMVCSETGVKRTLNFVVSQDSLSRKGK